MRGDRVGDISCNVVLFALTKLATVVITAVCDDIERVCLKDRLRNLSMKIGHVDSKFSV